MASDMHEETPRRQRIQRLKRIIITTVILSILIPIVLCILLMVRVSHLEAQLRELEARLEETVSLQAADENASVLGQALSDEPEYLPRSTFDIDEVGQAEPGRLSEQQFLDEESSATRRIYLTFDDGPSSNTDEILDVLAAYDIKATFFVNIRDEAYNDCYARIVEEGHSIGMHSATHDYDSVYASVEAFTEDLDAIWQHIYDLTGVDCKIYRFPGGSSNEVSRTPISQLVRVLEERGITYYDWNCMSGDATNHRYSAQKLCENVLESLPESGDCIILMHDADNKDATVESLPLIIEALEEEGDVSFFPITSQTEPVHHITFTNE